MKICSTCGESKELSEFHRKRKGLSARCKICAAKVRRAARSIYGDSIRKASLKYGEENPERILLANAKARAKKGGYPFDLVIEDITIPEYCPVFPWIKLKRRDGDNAPSIDKIEPSLGYVRGNICIMSRRANILKRDSTIQEREALVQWDINRLQQ